MRILFMGTPEFAAASLKRLYEDGQDICGVFTQPDKPVNRGMKLSAPPVKKLAMEHNTPVFQPEKLRDGTAMETVRELQPELIVVVAYGRLLPEEMLEYPKYGCINVHGSLLPKYRGAAPVQWAVLNGDRTTGVTTMYLAKEMDTGDIIDTMETEIGEDETSDELFGRLMNMGAELLSRTVRDIENGTAGRTPQDHSRATYTTMLTKTMSPIDWTRPAQEIKNQIRGLQSWPCATAEIHGKRYKIHSAVLTGERTDKAPGSVVSADKHGLKMACGNGEVLEIAEIQAEGKKRMSAADMLRGNPIQAD